MSHLQIRAVAMLVVLSMLDGYDVVSVSYAGPVVAQSLQISKTALGAVFSSGLIGMAVGSLLLAPLADIFGRRAAVLGALMLMLVGGVASALSGSAVALAGSRVVSGLGIGTLVAVTTPLAAEFANRHRRAFAVAVTTMAFPLGGMLGGLAAAVLMREFGWQSVFAVKSLIAIMLLPIVLSWLPESPSYLMSSKKPDAAERLGAFLTRCGYQPATILLGEASKSVRGYTDLFASGQLGVTLKLVAVNGLFAMVGYFWGSWLPTMVVDAGYTASTASVISAINHLAGVMGGLILGFVARWIKLRSLTIGALMAAGVVMVLFGHAPGYLPLLTFAAASCGFCIHASISGLYTTIATSFGEHIRASGTGLVIGVGRITSSIAPLLAGWMFASGYGRNSVSATFAALAILAALILALQLGAVRRPELHQVS